MFSLIITIISIALVAALAIASVYYGGDAFTQGTAKANAATVVAQAQQISAANTLYKNDNGGNNAASVAALVTGNYLQSAPVMPASVGTQNLQIDPANGSVGAEITNLAVCTQINAQLGVSTTPTFDSATQTPGQVITQQYGCAQDTVDSSLHFVYK